jgi:hypothetical protein
MVGCASMVNGGERIMGKVKNELMGDVGCVVCETLYPRERANLGYRTCTECGEVLARQQAKQHTIVPMHKSNYVVITNRADLRGINNKGGFFR